MPSTPNVHFPRSDLLGITTNLRTGSTCVTSALFEQFPSSSHCRRGKRILGLRVRAIELNRSRGRFRGESFREAHLRPA